MSSFRFITLSLAQIILNEIGVKMNVLIENGLTRLSHLKEEEDNSEG